MDIQKKLLEILSDYTDGRITSAKEDDVLTADFGLNSFELFDLVCDAVDAGFCELVCVIDGGVCLADGGGDLGGVEYGLRAVSFDDVHEWAGPSFCFRDVFWLPGA